MPKLAANITMMFNEVEFLDRFAAAAARDRLFGYVGRVRRLGRELS